MVNLGRLDTRFDRNPRFSQEGKTVFRVAGNDLYAADGTGGVIDGYVVSSEAGTPTALGGLAVAGARAKRVPILC
jgi:hypothetical protein